MTNRELLRKYITDRGLKMKHLADECGISAQAFSAKMVGKSEFNASEMAVLKEKLGLSDSEFITIFFDTEVA